MLVGSEHPVRVQTMTTTGARSSCPSLLHLAYRSAASTSHTSA